MAVKLSQLLKPWLEFQSTDCDVLNINNDSRLVKSGDLFVAYPGALADGRLFMAKAVAAGAVAIVYEPENLPVSCTFPATVPCLAIPNLAGNLATIANRFYNHPSESLYVTGITGTNGKTTIAYQLAQAHHLLGNPAAYIGTIGQGPVDNLSPLNNTTPDAFCLQSLLHQYKQQGLKQVCMEVSSHALSQKRVATIQFKQAIFTNLTLDHLDYHLTMDAYASAKAQLFQGAKLEFAILNRDDSYYEFMSKSSNPAVKQITYGMREQCDVQAVAWQVDLHGTRIDVCSPWGTFTLKINALGEFNIYNSLAICASLLVSGYPVDKVVHAMTYLKAAPGRMEIVATAPYVLVDYAHTPDALQNVLTTLSQLKKGKLWVVFGCGGDRDKSKRPVMGQAAGSIADKIIITSDNPRSEDPETIINEIAIGIPSSVGVHCIINREEAIAYALNNADINDIILIAGKGHEAYQQIGSVKYDFSDQEVVKRWIQRNKVNT